jgi:hypothetical protein
LYSNTTGNDNSAFGVDSMSFNSSGYGNAAFGSSSLNHNTVGTENAAFGDEALLRNTDGADNVGIGNAALALNVDGSENTAVGTDALDHSTGDNNIGIGSGAGSALTSGDSNIDIGSSGVAGESYTMRLGFQGFTSATYIAGISGTTISPTGVEVYVNTNGQLGTTNSSQRYKRDIQDMGKASDALLALRPVTFRYKQDLDPAGTVQYGLVAEEVERVSPDLVVRDSKGQVYSVRYAAVNAMLLNEFQKQHELVETLSKARDDQARTIADLTRANAQMMARLAALERAVAAAPLK